MPWVMTRVSELTRMLMTSHRHPGEGRGPALKLRLVQVFPFRVHLLDDAQLPQPIPFLHLLLAADRQLDLAMGLVPDEHLAAVRLREPVGHRLPVLPDPPDQIAG